jgi:hypothetical protein
MGHGGFPEDFPAQAELGRGTPADEGPGLSAGFGNLRSPVPKCEGPGAPRRVSESAWSPTLFAKCAKRMGHGGFHQDFPAQAELGRGTPADEGPPGLSAGFGNLRSPVPKCEGPGAPRRVGESASRRVSKSASQQVSESASQRVGKSAQFPALSTKNVKRMGHGGFPEDFPAQAELGRGTPASQRVSVVSHPFRKVREKDGARGIS